MRTEPSSQATLLVFTLGPETDCRRRPLLPRRLRGLERELRRHCLEEILDAGRDCGLALAVATDTSFEIPLDVERFDQEGHGFAERLESAVGQAEAARPGRPLVLVGADLPGLGAAHLEAAADRLAADPGTVVVGPSPDGGVYLIAASGELAPLLRRVDWCRRHTCAHLVDLLAAAGRRVVLLPPLADLDRPADLDRLLASAPAALFGARLARLLLAALRQIRRPLAALEIPLPWFALLIPHPHRGPPA